MSEIQPEAESVLSRHSEQTEQALRNLARSWLIRYDRDEVELTEDSLIDLMRRAALSPHSEHTEQALREITAEEVLEIHRGIVWYAQEENGWNIGWSEFARRINELIRYRPAALSPQTDSQEPR